MSTIERADTDIQRDVREMIGGVGLPLVATVEQGVVTLEGIVLSEEEHQAAIDLASFVSGVTDIVDSLEIMDMENDQPNILFGMPTRPDQWDPDQGDDFGEASVSLDEIETADAGSVEGDWTTDERVAIQDGATYFPPTDPPTDLSSDPDGIEVAAGFQATSLEDNYLTQDEALRSRYDVRDSEIVDNVVRELNEDASTTQLNIHVASVNGTVFLTGYSSDPNDGNLAAAVAERVDGVREVVDRLVVGESPVTPRLQRIPGTRRPSTGRVPVPSAAWRSTVARNERWLETEYAKVVEQLEARKAELAEFGRDQADEGSVSNHQGDIASDVTSAGVLNTEVVNLQDELDAINQARLMMQDNRYGICIVCGRLIDPARLRAYPLVLRCIEDQERFEMEEGTTLDAGQRSGI